MSDVAHSPASGRPRGATPLGMTSIGLSSQARKRAAQPAAGPQLQPMVAHFQHRLQIRHLAQIMA